MIAASATMLARIGGARYTTHWRLLIEDADGAMRDYSDQQGIDWRKGCDWGKTVDSPIAQGTVEVFMEADSVSLAPLIGGSPLNRNSAGGYAKAIDMGRKLQIWTQDTEVGVSPVETDWVLVHDAIIQKVGKGSGTLKLDTQDRAILLQQKIIRHDNTYGSEAGTPVATVMQSLIDDTLGAGVFTLQLDGDPQYAITGTDSFRGQNVWAALEQLSAEFAGYVEYRDALTLVTPNRTAPTATSAVASIGPDQYKTVPRLDTDLADIRNDVDVTFRNRATGEVETVNAVDTASRDDYGEQYMGITLSEDSAIDTTAEGQDMADRIVSDIGTPRYDHQIVNWYWYPVELGDHITWLANGRDYDHDQHMAVTGYRHTLSRDKRETLFDVRGKASAGFKRWIQKGDEDGLEDTGPRIARVFTSSQTETQITKTFWTEATSEVWLYINQAPQGTPEPLTFNSAGEVVDESGVAVEPLLLTVTDGATSHTFDLPAPDEVIYLMAEPRDSDLEAGEIWEGEIHPIDRDLTVTPLPRQQGSTGILRLEINDPRLVASGDAEFRVRSGDEDSYGAWVSTWDSTTGVAGTDENLVREEAIALAAKHTGSIEYRVPFTDEDGVQRYQSGEHTFDLDRIAETGGFIHFSATGEIIVVGVGDEDATKHYVTAQAGTPPLDPTAASNNGTIAARVGAVNTTVRCALGQVAYAKIVAEDANGNLGPVVTVEMRRGVGENLPLEYGYDVSQSGSTGTMAVEVYDETKAVLAVKFQKRSGTAGFGGVWLTTWDGSTGVAGTDTRLQRSESVALAEKHTSDIKVLIEFRDEDGNDHIEGSIVYPPVIFGHSFDLDTIAEITSIAPGIGNSGAVFATVTGDEDTANRYIRVTTDGTTPTDPTSASNDGSGAGRSGRIAATGKTAASGDVVTVKAVGYDSGGNPGPVQSTRWTVPHDPGAETNPAAIRDTVVLTNDTGAGGNNVYTATWKWNVATTSSYTVDIEYYENGVKVGTTTGTPATDGTVSFTDTGAGDGAADDHHGIMFLYNPSSELVATFKTFTIKSTF